MQTKEEEFHFTVLGKISDLEFGRQFSISRAPWPFFDTSGSPIIFGDYVMVSSGVYIHTHSHHFNKANWRTMPKITNDEPTIIGDYAFLGTGCQIMPSCKYTGKHSVVAAGSIVTKNIPDYEIWAGNPAVRIGGVG